MQRVPPWLALFLVLLPGCLRPGEAMLAGEELGRYRVQAELTANECGEGHPAPPSLNFLVDLRHLPGSSQGYWKLPDGPLIDGQLTPGAEFRFEQSATVVAVQPDPATMAAGCTLERREVVSGTLNDLGSDPADASTPDAGSALDAAIGADGGPTEPEQGLGGTTLVSISPMPGGDCSALLTVFGGAFPTLPCSIQYRLQGALQPSE